MDDIDSAETQDLLSRIAAGDVNSRDVLVERHMGILRRMIACRMDGRVSQRFDPSDVVQETQIDVISKLDDFLRRRPMPFRIWLLKTAHQRLVKLERQHLVAAKRSVAREIPIPDQSTLQLARQFISRFPGPEREADMREVARQIRQILASMSENDREIITLRNFQGLSNDDAAMILDLQPETAKKRYTRALLRLERRLTEAGLTGSQS